MNGGKWVLAAVVAVVAGCSSGSAPEAVPDSPAPASTPFAAAGSFEAPRDGRLTAAQVEMYIEVGRRARAQGAVASVGAPSSLADLAAAERRAAAELGRDVEEYRWVSARIAEASPAAPEGLGGLAAAIETAAVAGRDRIVGEAADRRAPATPADTGLDAAARADNRLLLDRYRSDLDALRPAALTPPPAVGPPQG